MVEVLDGRMAYITVDEKKLVEQIFRIKDEAAIYYKNGKKIAYHWLLDGRTIRKLKIHNK